VTEWLPTKKGAFEFRVAFRVQDGGVDGGCVVGKDDGAGGRVVDRAGRRGAVGGDATGVEGAAIDLRRKNTLGAVGTLVFPEEMAVLPLEALAAFRILKAVVLASAATVICVFEECWRHWFHRRCIDPRCYRCHQGGN